MCGGLCFLVGWEIGGFGPEGLSFRWGWTDEVFREMSPCAVSLDV